MKKLFAGMAIAALSGSSAFAADMPVKAPYLKAPALAVYDWTGFYIGVNAGVGLGRDLTEYSAVDSGAVSYLNPLGAVGGVQAGYNWQAGNWVFGLETDIQAASMRDDRACFLFCVPGNLARFDQKLDWFGTTRGRIGLASGPVLSYFTGGVAYGGVKTSVNDNGLTSAFSETRTGWTVGSGIEASLGGNWTGKLEYLYLDLGSQTGSNIGPFSRSFTSEIRENIFRAGLNYRIGGNAAYAAAPTANWTGFYLGGNFGGGTARNPTTASLVLPPATVVSAETFNLSPTSGILGGGQIGYNWQAANWVLGLEADFQGSAQKDDKACVLGCAVAAGQFLAHEQRLPWFGTARGRIGYSLGSTLFYATGGLAYGEVTNRVTEAFIGSFSAEFKHTKTGFAVGGGVETPFDVFGLFGKNWTAKTEYLYVDLGKTTDTYTFAGFDHTIDSHVQEHIFRSGLNYHFNAPVVAKY